MLMIPAALLQVQTPRWYTFYAAYQDGLEAQKRGDHALAVQAFLRAIDIEPRPGGQVKTYGLNFLASYHPYLRLAESRLAQGDLPGAEQALAQSERYGLEPRAEREALHRVLLLRKEASQISISPRPTLQRAEAMQPSPASSSVDSVPISVAPALLPPTPTSSPGPSTQALKEPAGASGTESRVDLARPSSSVTKSQPLVLPPSRQTSAPSPAEVRSSVEPSSPSPQPLPGIHPRPWLWTLGGATLLAAGYLFRRRRSRPPQNLTPSAEGLIPNRDFGPYRILGFLGEGGCASAYHGIHRTTGQEVAIKVPHHHLARDPQFRARFQREAALGARLEHPRIVRILTSDPEESDLWLAMDFIRGITLEDHLQRVGPLPVPQAVHLALDVAEAIAHAHAQSVVHRDLKPANIMLNAEGAVVMDFGVARVLDGGGTNSTMFVGTPTYAAPECLTNPQVGPPADRYALGLVLFEMLAGRPAFTGPSTFQLLEAHRAQPLPDLAELCPEVPPALARLVQRLCAKNPTERPEDGEMLAILRRLQTTPSWPPPPGVPRA